MASKHNSWFSFSPSNALDFATWLPVWQSNILSFSSNEWQRCTVTFGLNSSLVSQPKCWQNAYVHGSHPSLQGYWLYSRKIDPSLVLKSVLSGSNQAYFAASGTPHAAMLQFLSLAYDHLTSVSPLDIQSLFSKVASSFDPNQLNFAGLGFHRSISFTMPPALPTVSMEITYIHLANVQNSTVDTQTVSSPGWSIPTHMLTQLPKILSTRIGQITPPTIPTSRVFHFPHLTESTSKHNIPSSILYESLVMIGQPSDHLRKSLLAYNLPYICYFILFSFSF